MTHFRDRFILYSANTAHGSTFVVVSAIGGNGFATYGLRDGVEIDGCCHVFDTLRRAINHIRRVIG